MAGFRQRSGRALGIAALATISFYLGLHYADLRGRIVNEIPARGLQRVDLPHATTKPLPVDTEIAPVRLDDDTLPVLRAALKKRIFGSVRQNSSASLTEITNSAFATHFTGRAAFETYYRRLFAGRRMQIIQIEGAFEEIRGYRWRSILLRQSVGSPAGLFVYYHGHDGNPFAFAPPNQVIRGMIERGYDVIVHCMPGVGWNGIGAVRIKTWDGWGQLTDNRNERHALFTMIDAGDGHFIRFFIEPVLAALDQAQRERPYGTVVMAGHSGGGWATTIAAALDERIDYSLSYAGTLPFFARRAAKDLGDEEQMDSGFYRDFPYPLLYELASGSAAKRRVHYQLFNAVDPVAFDEDGVAAFQRYLTARPFRPDRDLRIAVIRNTGHYMAADAVLEIIGRLGPVEARR